MREAFHASGDVYGAPRIARELAAGGVVVDRKTIAASMPRQGLEGISPSMFTPVTTIQDPATRGFADHAERQWEKGCLDAAWTSDITYLPTSEGWLFLAGPGRGRSRCVLDWAMGDCQGAGLIDRALRMAHTLRDPVPNDLVFHAGRGVQYTSKTLFDTCEELAILQSMGRTGVCWDNALAETVNGLYKAELIHHHRTWPAVTAVEVATRDWVNWWKTKRLQEALGYRTPAEVEASYTHPKTTAPAPV